MPNELLENLVPKMKEELQNFKGNNLELMNFKKQKEKSKKIKQDMQDLECVWGEKIYEEIGRNDEFLGIIVSFRYHRWGK